MIQRRKLLALSAASATLGTFSLPARSAQGSALGLSLPLTGAQAQVGKELLIGYEIAQMAHAPDLALRVLDDAGTADLTAANVAAFAGAPGIIASSGIVGTPNAQAAMEVIRKSGLPVVGLRSGVASLRTGEEGVYHLRATYESEIDAMVASLRTIYRRIIVIYNEDSFGIAMRNYLDAALQSSNAARPLEPLAIQSRLPLDRDNKASGKTTDDVVRQLHEIYTSPAVQGTPTAIIMLSLTGATVSMVKKMHREAIVSPVFAMSFVATSTVATIPDPALSGMGLISAFPFPWASMQPMVSGFRRAAKAAKRDQAINSMTSFEGYFYGAVAALAWRRAGSRDRMTKALDLGVVLGDSTIHFDANKVGFNYLQVVYKSASGRLHT